jgi:cell division protein FtsB
LNERKSAVARSFKISATFQTYIMDLSSGVTVLRQSLFQKIRPQSYRPALRIICCLTCLYFGYHSLYGEKGLIAHIGLQQDLRHLQSQLALVTEKNEQLSQKIMLLKSGSSQNDLLEERLRSVLNVAHPRDVTVFYMEDE